MRRILPFVPPILLCLVAVVQVYLVKAQELTPWKGGGFGMFSTNDDGFRRIQVWVEEPGGEREIDVTRDLRVVRIAAHPTEERLTSVARKIGEVQRARGADVRRVRAAVWRRDFAPGSMEPLQVPIREVTVDLGPTRSP
ncbi:MAG TPA: hypothetical protein VFQ21_07095 [Gemmatimonadota bacterium]|nr:hypothetical protein [Gemmatimonadota bacterium]